MEKEKILSELTKSQTLRTIETPTFSIKGNLLFWGNTLIPINNISLISITSFEVPQFPKYALILLVVGCGSLFFNILLGLLLIAMGIGWGYLWFKKVRELDKQKNLNLLLNSGNTITIVFTNKDFLMEVHKILINVFSSPEPNYNITFDIKNNTFHDNSGVFS